MSPASRSPAISDELRSRLLVVAVIAPVSVLAIYLDDWYLTALVAAISGLAAHEFYNLARDRAGRPLAWLGVPAAALLVLIAAIEPSFHVWGNRALTLLLLLGLLAVACSTLDRSTEQPLLSATATVSGVLYTGGTLSFALLLRHLPEIRGAMPVRPLDGFMLVMLPVAVTALGDSASYFVGKRMGRTRLAPRLSPGKTVEGSIGGLAGAVVTGYVAGLFMDKVATLTLTPVMCAGIGLLLGIAGQLGDLSESLLKREAGVKDSGDLLPGHGGVLDRFDSLLFTVPLAYGLVLLAQVVA